MIYKVESTWSARDIKISKTMHSSGNPISKFAHLATVERHMIGSSRIKMGNFNVATNDYFKEEIWLSGRLVGFQLWRCKVSQP